MLVFAAKAPAPGQNVELVEPPPTPNHTCSFYPSNTQDQKQEDGSRGSLTRPPVMAGQDDVLTGPYNL